MKNRPGKNYPSLSFTSGLKLLAIIAFWETCIMMILSRLGPFFPLVNVLLDTTSLTFLSGISIWLLIILPEKKRDQKQFSQSIHFMGQEISAIDQIGIASATDLSGKIIYANDNFCKISGYSREELYMKDHRILNSGYHSKETFEQMWSTLKGGKPWRGEVCNKKKNGELYWVDAHIIPIFDAEGKPCKYISFRFDITAEKLVEQALEQEKAKSIHMGRLSAIGEMAAGIAHEINNPLAIINGLLSSVERRLHGSNPIDEIPKILENTAKARNQVIRMSKIINGLREFSRSGDNQFFEQMSLKKILDSVEDLCSEKLKSLNIQIEIQAEEIEFQCNPIQIEQVLINLINNSADAISNLDQKWIKIEAIKCGNFIEISVNDSGPGISEEVAQKIMQPFFTTKEIGKGTGLGLSISRGIIQKHGGSLYPDPISKNTRFVVQVPLNESALIDLINLDEEINVHLAMKHKLLDPSLSYSGIDTACAIEKWIERIEPRFKNNPHFIELKMAHFEFHKFTGEILRSIHLGDQTVSELTLGPGSNYDQLSKKFISAVHAFRLISTSSVEADSQRLAS